MFAHKIKTCRKRASPSFNLIANICCCVELINIGAYRASYYDCSNFLVHIIIQSEGVL